MSTFAVTVEKLNILEHPQADALELAQVGLYRAVVAKGAYKSGDLAVFVPEQGVLPSALIDALGLTGKLAGSNADRVKAIRLRGELSQGVVIPLSLIPESVDVEDAYRSKADISGILGIFKWVPEIPVHMSGQAYGAGDMLRWVDIENIKRFPDIFPEGEMVTATEKIHGTCTVASYSVTDDTLHVSSKGFAAKSTALTESETNLYWRSAHAYDLKGVAAAIADRYGATAVGIYGETYGKGVQDLHYGAAANVDGKPGYAMFDIKVQYANGEQEWLDFDVTAQLAAELNVPCVPILYRGPYSADKIAEVAEGKETISGQSLNVREGVVVRPVKERKSEVLGGRAIGKWVSEGYLTRKGGTEYE